MKRTSSAKIKAFTIYHTEEFVLEMKMFVVIAVLCIVISHTTARRKSH